MNLLGIFKSILKIQKLTTWGNIDLSLSSKKVIISKTHAEGELTWKKSGILHRENRTTFYFEDGKIFRKLNETILSYLLVFHFFKLSTFCSISSRTKIALRQRIFHVFFFQARFSPRHNNLFFSIMKSLQKQLSI